MSDRDGGPAFPRTSTMSRTAQTGMTLRQWYAGQALAGMIASQHQEVWDNPGKAAAWARQYADAMVEEMDPTNTGEE